MAALKRPFGPSGLRLHQTQIAVLAQVKHVGPIGFHVDKHEEAVPQQFHLQGRILHAHRAHREGLVAHHLGSGFVLDDGFGARRVVLQLAGLEGILAQALAQLGTVLVNLPFQLGQGLVDADVEVVVCLLYTSPSPRD